ncbi:MAG: S-layer family protein, partial [Coleofasciculus sp. G2-EDA-02]
SGDVLVEGEDMDTLFPSALRTDTFGKGDAGSLTVNTPVLIMEDGALIASSSFPNSKGDGGAITIFASESVQLSESRIVSQTEGTGDAGNVRIDTPLLIVRNQAQVIADTNRSSGNAGMIDVNAAQVQLDSGGQITSITFSNGDAGDILLQVKDSVTIAGNGSGIFANTEEDSSGNGGSIIIDSRTVFLQDQGQVAVDSKGIGRGGDIRVEADSLSLEHRARISAETDANTGGNITLIIDDLLFVRDEIRISTNAGKDEKNGDGGNIIIEADLIVGVPNENSDITANAFSGRGGNVTITTQGLFNVFIRSNEELKNLLEPDDPLDPELLDSNDITAISQTSPELSRTPTLNLSGIDPAQGLVELPAELVDVTRLVEQSLCAAAQGSEFIITGRGGLPKPPNQVLDADATWEDWRITAVEESTEVQQSNRNSRQHVTGNTPNKFVEAQGWLKDANGTIILTAEPTVVTPHETGTPSFTCQ